MGLLFGSAGTHTYPNSGQDDMVSYQGMQSGLPVLVVGAFGTSETFYKNDCLVRPDSSHFSTTTSKIDHIWTKYDHILYFLITNQLYLDSGLLIKL